MFRAGQPNTYDDIVGTLLAFVISRHTYTLTLTHSLHGSAKTTDENLTTENWELILNLCDKVQDEGEQG